ncbi:helix-hairpin-helix domain-containing protein [Kitasatospora sp. NPDC001132]
MSTSVPTAPGRAALPPREAVRLRVGRKNPGSAAGLAEPVGDIPVDAPFRERSYRLTEVRGFGFRLADKVALSLGWPETGEDRLQAGLTGAAAPAGVLLCHFGDG